MFFSRIDRERGAPRLFSENSTEDGPFDLTAYPLYDEILQHVDYYANDSEDVSKLEIGKSLLDKPIVGLKVSSSCLFSGVWPEKTDDFLPEFPGLVSLKKNYIRDSDSILSVRPRRLWRKTCRILRMWNPCP